MVDGRSAGLDIPRQVFNISRQSRFPFPAEGVVLVGTVIQATCLWGYRELVHALGGHPSAFLTRFGIPPDADASEGEFVDYEAFAAMLETTADELDCPDFGLRLSRWHGLDVLGPVAVIVRNSETVLKAIDAVTKYLYVHSPAMSLDRTAWLDGPDAAFRFELSDAGLPDLVQCYELSMAVAVRILHVIGGPNAAPSSISFRHARHGSVEAYQILECPVIFGQSWCGFALSEELGARRIEGADPVARRLARRYLDSRYVPPSAPLRARVADLARSLLPTGQCSVEAIAAELAMQPRTLQRHLAAEGTRCQDVIDRERRGLTARYLANPNLQLSQIVGLVGYTEQSALNRSCRRWFDRTPRQYRAALRQPVAAP